MIENNAVRTWRSTTNMHGDRRHQRSDWAAHRKRKVEEVSGSRSPAICSDPSNQKSTLFKLASRLKQAEHPRQPLLNGSERSVAMLFTPWGWFYSSPGTGDWVAGPVPESLLVKVSAKKKKHWADSNWNCAHASKRISCVSWPCGWKFFIFNYKNCGLPSLKHSSPCSPIDFYYFYMFSF